MKADVINWMCFSSQTKGKSAPSLESDAKILVEEMQRICLHAPYAPPQSSLETFVRELQGADPHVIPILGLAFVSQDDKKLAGFVQGRVVFESAELDYIATDGPYKRRGIAAQLVHMFEQECKNAGAERVLLEVGTSNTGAQALYENFGYKQISSRKKYYNGHEDALILEKIL